MSLGVSVPLAPTAKGIHAANLTPHFAPNTLPVEDGALRTSPSSSNPSSSALLPYQRAFAKSYSVDDVSALQGRVTSAATGSKRRLPYFRRGKGFASSVTDVPRPQLRLNLPVSRLTSSLSDSSLYSPVSSSCRSPLTFNQTASGRRRRMRFPCFDAVEILPGLFLAAHHCASDVEALFAFGVSLVVNVAEECGIPEDIRSNRYGIRHIHFSLQDHSDESIQPLFFPISRIIHFQLHRRRAREAECDATAGLVAGDETPCPSSSQGGGGGVLVHCRMGVSRSATIILAYLMLFGSDISEMSAADIAALWTSSYWLAERQAVQRLRGKAYGAVYDDDNTNGCDEQGVALRGNIETALMEERTEPPFLCATCQQTAVEPARRLGMRMEQALHHVHRVKPDINPNIGFVMALKELAHTLGDEERG